MDLNLPLQLVSKHDVLRTLRELEAIEDVMTQEGIRQSSDKKSIGISPLLTTVARVNKLDLNKQEHRSLVGDALIKLREHAPVVHISFAVEPSAQVVERVLTWFRKEVNPGTLLQIGIQPSIAAGCVVRTTNMYFDFSLRQHLLRNSNVLLERLKGLV